MVAADPDSESGKARRARELDVPLIAKPVFLAMLDRGISHHSAAPSQSTTTTATAEAPQSTLLAGNAHPKYVAGVPDQLSILYQSPIQP